MLLRHVKLKTGLLVDLSELTKMSQKYINKAFNIMMTIMNTDDFGYLLNTIFELANFMQNLHNTIPGISKILWQGINKFFLILSKYYFYYNKIIEIIMIMGYY